MQKKIARTFHHAMRSTLLIMRAMLLIMRAACPAAELLHGRRRSRTRPRKTRRAHPLHQRRNVAPARQHTTIQRPLAVGLRKVTHRCLLSPLGAFLAPRKAQQFASWPRMAGILTATAQLPPARQHTTIDVVRPLAVDWPSGCFAAGSRLRRIGGVKKCRGGLCVCAGASRTHGMVAVFLGRRRSG